MLSKSSARVNVIYYIPNTDQSFSTLAMETGGRVEHAIGELTENGAPQLANMEKLVKSLETLIQEKSKLGTLVSLKHKCINITISVKYRWHTTMIFRHPNVSKYGYTFEA